MSAQLRYLRVVWCFVVALVLACGFTVNAFAEEAEPESVPEAAEVQSDNPAPAAMDEGALPAGEEALPADEGEEADPEPQVTGEEPSDEVVPDAVEGGETPVEPEVIEGTQEEPAVETEPVEQAQEAVEPVSAQPAAVTVKPAAVTTKPTATTTQQTTAAQTTTQPTAPKATATPKATTTTTSTSAKPATTTMKAAATTTTTTPKKGKGDLAEGSYYIVSALRMGAVVDVAAGSEADGANVQLYTVNGTGAQKWVVEIAKDGFAIIRNLKSGKVLDVAAAKNANDTNVQQYKSNGTKAQKWIIKKYGSQYVILSALDGNFVLDAAGAASDDGTNFQIYTRNNSKAQLFSFVSTTAKKAKAGTKTISDGVYTLRPNNSSTRVLSVTGASNSSGANVEIDVDDPDDGSQAFRFTYDGKGFYTITNMKSGKKLAPKAACAVPGVNVGQYQLGDVDRAKWVVTKTGTGKYELRNKATNLALDIAACKDADGTNVQLYKANKSKAQTYSLTSLDKLQAGVVSCRPMANLSLAVDVYGGKLDAGTTLQTYASNHTMAQKFRIAKSGKGFTIQAMNSGLFLTGNAKGALTLQKASKSHAGQVWTGMQTSKGLVLKNMKTGLVLDVAGGSSSQGAKVATYKSNGTKAQAFLLRKVPAVSEGIYQVALSADPNQVLNTANGNRRNCANVDVFAASNTNLQKFHVYPVGGGAFAIVNVSTGKAMGVAAGSKDAGANVDLYTYGGSASQKWKPVVNADCSITFKNAKSGKVMDILGGKTTDGSNVQVYTSNGTKAQKFRLVGTQINFSETVVLGVPCYNQNPQLPTGCESVALTNALRYWGFKLNKTTMANRMPRGSDGVYNFIGNPRDESGWIICAPGITNMANSYLKSKGSSLKARNITGTSLRDLRGYLDKGQPVVVWTTIGMGQPVGLTYRHGYPLRSNNHAVVLSGYNPQTNKYQVADSLAGVVWRSGGAFDSLYKKMGKQAVVIED